MILIFAGAGASKAVNPDSYPTTVEFFQKLPTNIKNNLIFQNLEGYLKHKKPEDSPIDIEEILWTIYELEDFSNAISNKGNLIGWFLNDLKLLQSLGGNYDINPLKDVSRDIIDKASQLTQLIDRQVYDYFSEVPTKDDLENNWLPLLTRLLKQNKKLEIFTTNYDIVIETAIEIINQIEELPKIDTGRVATIQPHLDQALWEKPQSQSGEEEKEEEEEEDGYAGLLTKLHGSIDWSRTQNTIFVGTPIFTGDPSRHVIIYPGYKGGFYPSGNTTRKTEISFGPPINLFHEHFGRTLEKADIIIFIGFAFRDNHINEQLVKNISPNASIYVINPSANLPNIAFPSKKIHHIKKGFDNEAINELMLLLQV